MTLLHIRNLSIGAGEKSIVENLNLVVKKGEVHAIMGPNGSGKSTLVSSLMGHPKYSVTSGSASFEGEDLLSLSVEERARLGLFLAFQYPKEIAGVKLRSFLFAAVKAQRSARGEKKKPLSILEFQKSMDSVMHTLHMNPLLSERTLNHGFSGGEKKKSEILQMMLLKPKLALLDETDSGLDIDALKIVAKGVESMRGSEFSAIIVTHYARLLEVLKPDKVHVMVRGKIVESGGPELARKLEKQGYKAYSGEQRVGLEVGNGE